MSETRRYLSINRCPSHGFYSVSIDDELGGTRLTPSRCCGRWDLVKRWSFDEGDWLLVVVEATKAMRAVEDAVEDEESR